MLSGFSTLISSEGINIEAMVNKSRGIYAYTIVDVASCPSAETVCALTRQSGVIRVRVL